MEGIIVLRNSTDRRLYIFGETKQMEEIKLIYKYTNICV